MGRSYKYFFFICFTVFTGSLLFAQNKNIDSLNKLLSNTKNDTTRAGLLLALSEEFYLFNQDTVIPLCLQSVTIADKNIASANAKEKRSYLITKATALNNLGVIYFNKENIPLALNYYNKSLKIREDIGDKKGVAQTILSIGTLLEVQNNIPSALEYYLKSLKINEEIKDNNGIASSLNSIGVIYKDLGDITKALESYQRCLKIYEANGNKNGVAVLLNKTGNMYRDQGDLDKALDYFTKSKKIQEETGDRRNLANTLNSIGLIYHLKKEFNKAMSYFSNSLKLLENINDRRGSAHLLVNLGLLHNDLGNMSEALDYCKKSLIIREEIGDKKGMSTSLVSLGTICYKQKKYSEADYFTTRSLLLSRELGFPFEIRNAEQLLSKIDLARHNFAGAFEHYKQYIFYRDSINNNETRKASIKSQLKYEYDKKEAIINEQQDKERIIAEEKNRFQKIVIWSVCFGLLLVMIFSVFVFRSLKTTRKQKVIIEEKQKEILDSIHYARRIQRSLLPLEKYIEKKLIALQKNS